MEDILLPSKIELIPGKTEREARLIVEPCFHGYGTTLGNALRRVMLSSLPGAAVTAVKIKGAQHEFSSVPGVKEDTLEIVLNLKMLRLRLFSEEPVVRLHLVSKGEGPVTAGDIEKNADVEIVNPELQLATLTDKKSELDLEIFVSKGRGYVTTEERSKEKSELGVIAIDALFSPVREVGYYVDSVRVGRVTDFDKLIMDIETDGTMAPAEVVDRSVKILLDHFNLILNRGVVAPAAEEAVLPVEAAVEPAAAVVVEEAPAVLAAEGAALIEEEEEGKKAKKAKKPKAEKKEKKKK